MALEYILLSILSPGEIIQRGRDFPHKICHLSRINKYVSVTVSLGYVFHFFGLWTKLVISKIAPTEKRNKNIGGKKTNSHFQSSFSIRVTDKLFQAHSWMYFYFILKRHKESHRPSHHPPFFASKTDGCTGKRENLSSDSTQLL